MVSEKCVCGAVFNFTAKTAWAPEVAEMIAVDQFRRDHEICRKKKAEKDGTATKSNSN